jgi:hypothetical protein
MVLIQRTFNNIHSDSGPCRSNPVLRLLVVAFLLSALAHIVLLVCGFEPDPFGAGHWERFGDTEIWRYD